MERLERAAVFVIPYPFAFILWSRSATVPAPSTIFLTSAFRVAALFAFVNGEIAGAK
jgi:hypothetical protein